jgi:hypothetical protein
VKGGGTAFGYADDKGISCGAAFTDYNGSNIFVSIAIERPAGARWLLWAIGYYGFVQLGCGRLTFVTESSNIRSVKFQEKLGAVHEARLIGAGRNGDDILISRLTPDSRIWRKLDGKQGWRQRSGSTGLREHNSDSGTVEHQPVQHDAWSVAGELGNSVRDTDLVSAGAVR